MCAHTFYSKSVERKSDNRSVLRSKVLTYFRTIPNGCYMRYWMIFKINIRFLVVISKPIFFIHAQCVSFNSNSLVFFRVSSIYFETSLDKWLFNEQREHIFSSQMRTNHRIKHYLKNQHEKLKKKKYNIFREQFKWFKYLTMNMLIGIILMEFKLNGVCYNMTFDNGRMAVCIANFGTLVVIIVAVYPCAPQKRVSVNISFRKKDWKIYIIARVIKRIKLVALYFFFIIKWSLFFFEVNSLAYA